MTQLFTGLLEILNREADCCERILEQSKLKKEALIANDVAAIEQSVAVELELINLMTNVEQERLALTRRIAEKLGCPGEDLTISRTIELADEPHKSALKELKARLEGAIAEQSRLSDVNQSLIESQLNYIDYMINATTTPSSLSNTYTASGSAPESDERLKFFDHQI